MRLTRIFTEHPASAGESYLEHMGVAFGVARRLGVAAVAAAVHGVVPSLFTTTASDGIHELHDCLERGDREAIRHPRSGTTGRHVRRAASDGGVPRSMHRADPLAR